MMARLNELEVPNEIDEEISIFGKFHGSYGYMMEKQDE